MAGSASRDLPFHLFADLDIPEGTTAPPAARQAHARGLTPEDLGGSASPGMDEAAAGCPPPAARVGPRGGSRGGCGRSCVASVFPGRVAFAGRVAALRDGDRTLNAGSGRSDRGHAAAAASIRSVRSTDAGAAGSAGPVLLVLLLVLRAFSHPQRSAAARTQSKAAAVAIVALSTDG